MIQAFETNKPISKELKAVLSIENENISFVNFEKDGRLVAYLTESNINIEKMKKGVSIIVQDYDVPFLVIKYDDDTVYSMPILLPDEGLSTVKNSLTILAIEKNDYILKNIRTVGLSEEIMKGIVSGLMGISHLKGKEDISIAVNNVRSRYTNTDMCTGGVLHALS